MDYSSHIPDSSTGTIDILTGVQTENIVVEDYPNVISQISTDDLFLQNEDITAVQMLLESVDCEQEHNHVDIDNIQLYLECADDNENTLNTSLSQTYVNPGSSNATSQITSDLQFRISFPSVADDTPQICKCGLCKKVFCGKQILRDHVLLEHRDSYFICQSCDYFTRSIKRYQTHMKSRHFVDVTEEQLVCIQNAECVPDIENGKETVGIQVKELNEQESNDNAKIEENCLTDGPSDDQANKYPSKINTTFFKCDRCSYSASTKRLVGYHFRTMHNENRKLYKCKECGFECKQKRTFEAHEKRHQNILDFVCESCNKQFASRHLLTKHLRVHKKSNLQTSNLQNDSTRCNNVKNSDTSSLNRSTKANAETQTKILHRRKKKHSKSTV